MNEVKTQQIAFFGTIKEKINQQTLMAKEIAKLLGISTSEAYNKIAGKSMLTLPQIHLLCKTYNLNFLISSNKSYSSTLVEFLPFHQQNIAIDKYLFIINKILVDINSVKDKKLICATEDIPILHMFKYPELSAFKIYCWNRRNQMNHPNDTVPIFTRESISEENVKAAYELYLLYNQIPGVEIW
ncbi:MAG: helix-turn-helix domain-containing protein [Segetibacter sp.]